MTAFPAISVFPRLPRLPRLALSKRLKEVRLTEADMAATALIIAVPAALDATILWSMFQGGSVLHLALVYSVSGNLIYRLVLAALTRLQENCHRAG